VSRDAAALHHMLAAIDRIEQYLPQSQASFMGDLKTQDAVIRCLEIIGEASKRVSTELRARHPDVPWRQAAALRDVLSHDYMSINMATVWNAATKHLPPLRGDIERVLDDLPHPD